MDSLVSRIEDVAASPGAVTFVVGGTLEELRWEQLHTEAAGVAGVLQRRGVRRGSHVALLGPTSRRLVTVIEAIWRTGATLIVLPLPMRLASLEEFTEATRARVRRADTDLLVVDDDLAPFLGDPHPDDPEVVTLAELAGGPHPEPYERVPVGPDDLAILQFTSGSTSEPKGVMLPHRTVCANHDAMIRRVGISTDDVLVSWLPLYHDMGLVGILAIAMTTGCNLVLGAPQDFLGNPSRWMEWISEFGGTVTAGPNFAYVLATRALRARTKRNEPALDLSRLRLALNGAEPVDPQTVRGFIAAGAPHGLRPEAVFPAFGMAEVAIGGTFPAPLSGMRTDWVDGRVLERERYAAPATEGAGGARELVKLGRPLDGLEMRVVDTENGSVLGEREVGELQIRGSSVTPGYYDDPDATAEVFQDGWLCTGDLAYFVGGELVLCGRIKDVIIVGGRNVFPQDVERGVGSVEGVRAGNVIAFGVDGRHGKEALVVVAESRTADVDELRRTVAHRVVETVGIPARDVVLVEPGTLPKTSSGKLQRSLCKDRYLARQLQPAHAGGAASSSPPVG